MTYKMFVDGETEIVEDGSKHLDVCQNDDSVRVQLLFYVGDNPEAITWRLFDENNKGNGKKILIDSSTRTQPYSDSGTKRYSFYWSLKKCNTYRMTFNTAGLGENFWFLVYVNGVVDTNFQSSALKINVCD